MAAAGLSADEAPYCPPGMRFGVVVFTCARDYDRAKRAVAELRKNWHRTGLEGLPYVVFAVRAGETMAAREAFEGEEIFFHDFDAGGSLRYSGAIHGMRSVYRQLFAECDVVLKLDSDTLLFRPECFTAPILMSGVGFVAVRRYAADSTTLGTAPKDKPILNLCNGCAYLMTKEAFGYIDSAPPSLIDAAIQEANGHEDLFFSRMFSACDAVFCSHISKQLCVFDGDENKVTEKTVYLQMKKEGAK